MITSSRIFFILFVASCLAADFSPTQPLEAAAGRTLQGSRFQFAGEYGLWVELRGDEIGVHWLTVEEEAGQLQVYHKDRLLQEFATPRSRAHRAFFEDQGLDPLTLRYGSRTSASDRHETTIYQKNIEAEAVFDKVDSIYVLGDLHGEFDNLIQLLQAAQLIDDNLNWRGGKRHLVALGDVFDRGHDVTKTLWFLYRLERQAYAAGGRVHIVLGNHEIMTFCDDLRYLSGKENLIARMHGTTYTNFYNIRHSVLGKWLATKPGILKINEVLFAHGGIDSLYQHWSVEAYNDTLASFLRDDVFQYLLRDSLATAPVDTFKYDKLLYFFFAEDSPFWHRDYVLREDLAGQLNDVLRAFDSRVHVVAHTALPTISERYDGKVIAVDLRRPGTEVLLLIGRKTKSMQRFKINLQGELIPLKT